MRSIKKHSAQKLGGSEACILWFLQEGSQNQAWRRGTGGQPLALGDVGSSMGILKVGLALAGSMGMAGLYFQPAVGQAGEPWKTDKIFERI